MCVVKLTGKDKCNALNDFFASVGTGIYFNDSAGSAGYRSLISMFLDSTDNDKIFSSIMNVRNSKSDEAYKMIVL